MGDIKSNKIIVREMDKRAPSFLGGMINLVAKIPGISYPYRLIERFLLNILYQGRYVTYDMESLLTNKNCDFMRDPEFIKGYNAAMEQEYSPELGLWAVHINQWAAAHAKKLDGDFVECGVAKARHAMSNISYINFESLKNRKYYLFDTFCGLDKNLSSPEEYARYKDEYPECYEFVVDSFKKYPNVVIIRGSVPGTLSKVDIKKVAYLSIDMNCAVPEAAALEFFWPKLERGAIVVLDDYGQRGHEGQKKAIDKFASSARVKVLYLPTGQGIIIKP